MAMAGGEGIFKVLGGIILHFVAQIPAVKWLARKWEGKAIMSTNSLVMAAWRPRLYCSVGVLIISFAFFDALSMALRLSQDTMSNYR